MDKLLLRNCLARVRAYSHGLDPFQSSEIFVSADTIEFYLYKSWLEHYRNNPHHWQYWVVILDNGQTKTLPIPDQYRREMLADWLAVSRMPERDDIHTWYGKYKDKMLLHPETRVWLEKLIDRGNKNRRA